MLREKVIFRTHLHLLLSRFLSDEIFFLPIFLPGKKQHQTIFSGLWFAQAHLWCHHVGGYSGRHQLHSGAFCPTGSGAFTQILLVSVWLNGLHQWSYNYGPLFVSFKVLNSKICTKLYSFTCHINVAVMLIGVDNCFLCLFCLVPIMLSKTFWIIYRAVWVWVLLAHIIAVCSLLFA